MLQLAHALAYCHKTSVRVAHRDSKQASEYTVPANVSPVLIVLAVKPENLLLFPCAHERYQQAHMVMDPSMDPPRAKKELMGFAAGLGEMITRDEVRQRAILQPFPCPHHAHPPLCSPWRAHF